MSFQKKFTFSPQPQTERGRPIQLSVDPKTKTFLYSNGRSIILRDLANPGIASEYTGHACQATVARYSPSGYYIASGDVQGNIRIWDTVNEEHILKTETKIFSGKINDLQWDFESKRIIGVGEGKDRFGHAFLFDSASSVGEVAGHSKAVNSVSIKPTRPLRAVTGSDDMTVNFYTGVPFKYSHTLKEHSRFVQCVRYAPSGDFFISSGSDSKIFLYDGKEGQKKSEFLDGHKGSVFSVSWAPDSLQFISASADYTSKIWDVNTGKAVSTVTYADKPTFEHQQVGTLWAGSYVITASLGGDINYIDPRTPGKPVKVIKGHQRGITSLSCTPQKKIYSGSYDGRIYSWELGAGSAEEISGQGHTNQVVGIAAQTATDKVYSVGMDDSFRALSIKDKAYENVVMPTGSIPKGLSVQGARAAIVTGASEVVIFNDGAKEHSLKIKGYEPTVVTLSPKCDIVAVGGADRKIHLYDLPGLTEIGILEGNRGQISCIAYSPNGELIAAGDTERLILCFDVKTRTIKVDQWVFHSSRINSVSWSPDSKFVVSSSLDTNVEVWSVENPTKHVAIKGAHLESATNAVFLDNSTIASCGGDAAIRVWEITI